jgi:hypothetical protein
VRPHKFKIPETPNQVIRRGRFPLGHVGLCFANISFCHALLPKAFGDFDRVNIQITPPLGLLAGLMYLPMMIPTKRNGKLIADLHPHRPWLQEAQMMGIRRLPSAQELCGHEDQMGFVAAAFGASDRDYALVNLTRVLRFP